MLRPPMVVQAEINQIQLHYTLQKRPYARVKAHLAAPSHTDRSTTPTSINHDRPQPVVHVCARLTATAEVKAVADGYRTIALRAT